MWSERGGGGTGVVGSAKECKDQDRHTYEGWGLKVPVQRMPAYAGMRATMKSVGIFDKWGVWLISLHYRERQKTDTGTFWHVACIVIAVPNERSPNAS